MTRRALRRRPLTGGRSTFLDGGRGAFVASTAYVPPTPVPMTYSDATGMTYSDATAMEYLA